MVIPAISYSKEENTMKKFSALVLALVLLCVVPLSAMADGTLQSSTVLARSITLCKPCNTYVLYENRQYSLWDASGNQLAGPYADMSIKSSGRFVEVISNDGFCGLLDAATGSVVIPASYGDTYIVNEDWTMGIALVPVNGDESDYKSWDGTSRWNIDYVDVYYCGSKVTTLTRSEYRGKSISAHGAFLGIRLENTTAVWIDAAGNRTNVTDDYVSTSEFSDEYRKGVRHNPTQQYAFTSTCTLTADQVERSIWYTSDGNFVDLQGNVISQGPSAYKEYDSVNYSGGDYMCIRANSKYGIVNTKGEEVIPAIYGAIGGSSDTQTYFASGYQAMLDEKGRLVYLDPNGNVNASVDYTLSDSDYKGFYYNSPIIIVKNMGSYLVITATRGVLDTTYEDAVQSYSATQRLITVKKNGLWGCIDMNGDTVIPFVHKNSLEISSDGTLVTGRTDDGDYMLYTVSYASANSSMPEAPVLGEGEWLSSCGAVVSSKFCPECGEARPVPRCTNCGYEPADGTAPKFCPECGTKF